VLFLLMFFADVFCNFHIGVKLQDVVCADVFVIVN
jgi:hypothetical protein